MKIYTKKGDQGITSLLGGTKVPKHHARIEAYGSTDELNSFVGLLIAELPQASDQEQLLHKIQYTIFELGASLATEKEQEHLYTPNLTEAHILQLEQAIDAMQDVLPKLTHFIMPSGHRAIATAHICRTICRRAERNVAYLNETEAVHPFILPYLNRLSDYLFVVSRKLAKDFEVEEVKWLPGK